MYKLELDAEEAHLLVVIGFRGIKGSSRDISQSPQAEKSLTDKLLDLASHLVTSDKNNSAAKLTHSIFPHE